MEDPKAQASIVTASIVRDVRLKGVPDSYRLTVSCRPDIRDARIDMAWSPGSPTQGQVLSAIVDGKRLGSFRVEGTEKMGNYEREFRARLHPALSRREDSQGANRGLPLPAGR